MHDTVWRHVTVGMNYQIMCARSPWHLHGGGVHRVFVVTVLHACSEMWLVEVCGSQREVAVWTFWDHWGGLVGGALCRGHVGHAMENS